MNNRAEIIKQYNNRLEALHNEFSDLQRSFQKVLQPGPHVGDKKYWLSLTSRANQLSAELEQMVDKLDQIDSQGEFYDASQIERKSIADLRNNLEELDDDLVKFKGAIYSCEKLPNELLDLVKNACVERQLYQYKDASYYHDGSSTNIMQKLLSQRKQQTTNQTAKFSTTLQQGFFNNAAGNFNKHLQTASVNLDAMDSNHPHFLLMQELNVINQLDNGMVYSGQPGWEQSPQRIEELKEHFSQGVNKGEFSASELDEIKAIAKMRSDWLRGIRAQALVNVGGSRNNFSEQEKFEYEHAGKVMNAYTNIVSNIDQLQLNDQQLSHTL